MGQAKAIRPGAAGPAHLPRVAGNDEAIARDVERIEIGMEDLSLHRVELRVHQYPARLAGVPVLAYPMVFELARGEVRAKAASRTGRNTLLAKDCAQHQRKMTADAGHPIARLARDVQRTTVERTNPREHILDRTYMRVIFALVGKRHAIGEGRHVAMNQHALYDFA